MITDTGVSYTIPTAGNPSTLDDGIDDDIKHEQIIADLSTMIAYGSPRDHIFLKIHLQTVFMIANPYCM